MQDDTHQSPTAEKQRTTGATKRKKVNHACVYCRRSHMTCDAGRPCSRCVKRNIGHLCHDEVKEPKTKSPKKEVETSESIQAIPVIPKTIENSVVSDSEKMRPPSGPVNHLQSRSQALLPDPPQSQGQVQAIYSPRQNHAAASGSGLSAGNTDLGLTNDFSSPFNTTLFGFPQDPFSQFASEHTNSEFLVLSDFLSIISDTNGTIPTEPLANGVPFLNNGGAVYNSLLEVKEEELSTEQQLALQATSAKYTRNGSIPQSRAPSNPTSRVPSRRPSMSGHSKPSLNSESSTAQEKFFLTAADPIPESPEERLKQVINAKVEAGLMKPFNYVRGYARLQKYMDQNMSADSRSRILAPLSTFRPAFRVIAKKLTDVDLILVEEAFERLLLDYDRVFTSMAVPACLWRRTGEIFRGNKEFAALLSLPIESLRDGKLAITELMAEDSAVNYWEKYGNIAFDGQQKAVLTSCLLQIPGDKKGAVVSCCFSFTIKRDRYNIPSCIVGNFIPISL